MKVVLRIQSAALLFGALYFASAITVAMAVSLVDWPAAGVSGQPDLRTVRLPPDRKRLSAARQQNSISGRSEACKPRAANASRAA